MYVICPVRNATPDEKAYLEEYVAKLRQSGAQVHFPPQDTNQNGPVGVKICNQNFDAIIHADETHVFWNSKSTGSIFDFGGAYMAIRLGMKKKIVLVNGINPTPTKSFENVLLSLSDLSEADKGK